MYMVSIIKKMFHWSRFLIMIEKRDDNVGFVPNSYDPLLARLGETARRGSDGCG